MTTTTDFVQGNYCGPKAISRVRYLAFFNSVDSRLCSFNAGLHQPINDFLFG